ncbi:MAG: DUF423 domain-containing protein [Oceanococcaceae bacterium]
MTIAMSPALLQLMAGVYGFLAVALGAFAAHGLKSRLDAYALDIMATATQYALLHAVVLLALSLAPADNRWLGWAGMAFVCGTFVFSGSLYALALSGVRALGAMTPIGGLLLLIGWGLLIVGAAIRLTR